jgi:hypothetical protein
MSKVELTQVQADELLKLEKQRTTEEQWEFPQLGGHIRIPLLSLDKREQFMLDVSRNQINLERGKYQHRARTCFVLVRLDFGGPPHRNPDDEEVPCPHIHLYREGYGDSWASAIDVSTFPNIGDVNLTLDDFMRYCNISKPPFIGRGLFV